MELYLEAETTIADPGLMIDFIEVRTRSGEVLPLDWDESEQGLVGEGKFTGRYKGVYFNEEYANGRLEELEGMEVLVAELYSPLDAEGTFTVTDMCFIDGTDDLQFSGKLYGTERSSDEKEGKTA